MARKPIGETGGEALKKRLPARAMEDQRVSATWKAVIAYEMKRTTNASNEWLARELGLSSATYVSKQAGLVRRKQLRPHADVLVRRFESKT